MFKLGSLSVCACVRMSFEVDDESSPHSKGLDRSSNVAEGNSLAG